MDEEHEGAYKQEEGVIYNGRDMAIVRAQLSHATCVLSSATPALETEQNVKSGKYRHIVLSDRYGGAQMPEVHLVDLRKQKLPAGRWISTPLQQALEGALTRGEQSMLFLNRRGYAPLTLCRQCGYRVMCPHCSVSLVQHKVHNKLLCHHCGYVAALPKVCPECAEEDSFAPIGPGVERLHEEVRGLFPEARIALMTSDHMNTSRKIQEEIEKIQNHEVDILIGTQIMAKGHHFPLLTLVGIVDGDSALSVTCGRQSGRSSSFTRSQGARGARKSKVMFISKPTFRIIRSCKPSSTTTGLNCLLLKRPADAPWLSALWAPCRPYCVRN